MGMAYELDDVEHRVILKRERTSVKPRESIMWAGFQRGASESLIHAAREPEDVAREHLKEAIEAAQYAIEHATNDRQRQSSQDLIVAAQKLGAMINVTLTADAGQT